MATLCSSLGSFRALCLLSWGAMVGAGCGGRSDTEDWLFDDAPLGGNATAGVSAGGKKPGGAGTGTMGGSGSGGSPSAGGQPSAGGKASGGAGPIAGANPGGSSPGGVGQGGGSQAGSTGMAGAPAGGAGNTAPISCGGAVCDGLVEQCCATLAGAACIPEDEDCGGAVLNCGASSDCDANQVCCLMLVGEVGSGSVCRDSCQGVGAGRERQLCSSDAECRNSRRCRDTVFGISVCTRL